MTNRDKMTQIIIAIVAIIGVIVIGETNGRTTNNKLPSAGCQSNSECGIEECCVLGPYRFSIPQCVPRLIEGSVCRPSSSLSVNRTVDYPNGNRVVLTDVHDIMCPCTYGLTCDTNDGGTCRDLTQRSEDNYLVNGADTFED